MSTVMVEVDSLAGPETEEKRLQTELIGGQELRRCNRGSAFGNFE